MRHETHLKKKKKKKTARRSLFHSGIILQVSSFDSEAGLQKLLGFLLILHSTSKKSFKANTVFLIYTLGTKHLFIVFLLLLDNYVYISCFILINNHLPDVKVLLKLCPVCCKIVPSRLLIGLFSF